MTKDQYEDLLNNTHANMRRIEDRISEVHNKLNLVDRGIGDFIKIQIALTRAVRWNTRVIILLLVIMLLTINS